MEQDILLKLLEEWFESTNLSATNVWNQNPVARLIKKKLRQLKRFKHLPRGKPSRNHISVKKSEISTAPVPTPDWDW